MQYRRSEAGCQAICLCVVYKLATTGHETKCMVSLDILCGTSYPVGCLSAGCWVPMGQLRISANFLRAERAANRMVLRSSVSPDNSLLAPKGRGSGGLPALLMVCRMIHLVVCLSSLWKWAMWRAEESCAARKCGCWFLGCDYFRFSSRVAVQCHEKRRQVCIWSIGSVLKAGCR